MIFVGEAIFAIAMETSKNVLVSLAQFRLCKHGLNWIGHVPHVEACPEPLSDHYNVGTLGFQSAD